MTFRKRAENFFYYYKWHTLAALFVIVILAFSIYSAVSSHEPDLHMIYVSDKPISSEASSKLEKSLKDEGLIADVNGDSTQKFLFEPLITSMDSSNSDMATLQKLQVCMVAGTQSIMLLHQYTVEDYDGSFEDISKYAGSAKTITGSEGFVTGISVEGNKYLESIGINTENLYLSIHRRSEKDIEKGKLEKEYELAHKVAEYILQK